MKNTIFLIFRFAQPPAEETQQNQINMEIWYDTTYPFIIPSIMSDLLNV